MTVEEREWWEKFIGECGYTAVEVEYAFHEWLKKRTGDEWWPTGQQITDLCHQYRRMARQQELPVGCPRCDWTGWYQTHGRTAGSVELGSDSAHLSKAMLYPGKEVKGGDSQPLAPCPCRTNVSLRTPVAKRYATLEEMRAMWTLVKELGEQKKMPEVKRKEQANVVPTTKELAAQLRGEHEKKQAKAGRGAA